MKKSQIKRLFIIDASSLSSISSWGSSQYSVQELSPMMELPNSTLRMSRRTCSTTIIIPWIYLTHSISFAPFTSSATKRELGAAVILWYNILDYISHSHVFCNLLLNYTLFKAMNRMENYFWKRIWIFKGDKKPTIKKFFPVYKTW